MANSNTTKLPIYAGMIHQEHSETAVKMLLNNAVDFRISKVGCDALSIAIYAKFESLNAAEEFEAAVTSYQITQWS